MGELGDGLKKHYEEISNRNHYLRSLVLSTHAAQVSGSMLQEYDVTLEKGEFAALDEIEIY